MSRIKMSRGACFSLPRRAKLASGVWPYHGMRLANPVGRLHQSAAGSFFGFVPEGTPQRIRRNLLGGLEAG